MLWGDLEARVTERHKKTARVKELAIFNLRELSLMHEIFHLLEGDADAGDGSWGTPGLSGYGSAIWTWLGCDVSK